MADDDDDDDDNDDVTSTSTTNDDRPQVFATGYSTNPSLSQAIEEATTAALSSLPPATNLQYEIDLAIVTASSLYEEPSTLVPTLVKVVEASSGLYGYGGVKNLVGGTAGGVIGSRSLSVSSSKSNEEAVAGECQPFEAEATPAISVTLALLPDVEVKTFHLNKQDVPEFDGDFTRSEYAVEEWKKSVGLAGFGTEKEDDEEESKSEEDEPVFMVIPSPAFQNNLDDFLRGLQFAYPTGQTFGGVASTVSSLSRARIYAWSAKSATTPTGSSSSPANSVYGDGCVGVALKGDLRVDTMIAQGAKPVGGVYRVVAAGRSTPGMSDLEDEASRSTIGAIVLDETATVEDAEGEEDYTSEEEEEEDEDESDLTAEEKKDLKRAKLLADYAKARIPKPPLAEANFVMKALSDDDQAFMRSALLIGLERGGGSVGNTPNELARLAKGEGYRFTVKQVASAGMKDGSVTFPLGSVNVAPGARCRFFVRDGDFAKKEVEALWTGYKKKELEGTLLGGNDMSQPTGCIVMPTLDRGAKLFSGKAGYESGMASAYMSGIPSISGFFSNGVLGKLDGTVVGEADGSGSVNDNRLHGSSSQYVIFRSKTKRPFYSPRKAKAEAAKAAALKAEEETADQQLSAEDEKRTLMSKNFGSDGAVTAPRAENGELVVRRREIHSGRAMSVSTVEWSVAEKTAKPTSALEGYMWEKETQVDRLRERISLALLLSQTKMAMVDPEKPKPRDWIGPVKQAAGDDGNFVIIPECKRMEPVSGSLRKRYDLPKIVKELTAAGAPAISVNSDGVLFGGTMEDITTARDASNAAAVAESFNTGDDGDGVVAPPVLASDLLLYPYQLYKLRLAGADAVTLVVGALESKDLLYLTKIASTIQLQVVASVTSEVQIEMLSKLGAGSIVALVVSNRELESFDFDDSGEQALSLLRSEALTSFRENHGDVPVLVEGRVGIVEADGGDSVAYIQALKDAGAFGAIVGGGMAMINEEDIAESIVNWSL